MHEQSHHRNCGSYLLREIQANLLKKAEERRDSKTYTAKDMDEFERILNETPGFIKAMWCGEMSRHLNPPLFL